MIRTLGWMTGSLMAVALASSGVRAADEPSAAEVAVPAAVMPHGSPGNPAAVAPGPAVPDSAIIAEPQTPVGEALRQALAKQEHGLSDEERNEHAALDLFYAARAFMPVWMAAEGLTANASTLIGEFAKADQWGLEARAFALPAACSASAAPLLLDVRASCELKLMQAALLYARHARGGRIINPAEQLSTYLDRRPQLIEPKTVLEAIATAPEPDAYLRGLHPRHPLFERLREKYVALLGTSKGRKPSSLSADAKRLLANMEQWRWMPADLGAYYVWNNIPEYMQRVVKDGEVLNTERIVAGELTKQTPIFSRPLRRVTFKPTWKVPESIKVRELWPNLLRGGSLMREWALEIQTKDGQPVDWRKMDWAKLDIREYDVIQPSGRKNVLGKVKFSFPNPHTVFMHDTLERDKHMFNATQRTFSHGCMRVRNPMRLAELLLAQDKGWDTARVNEAYSTGPLNNEIALERWVPVHITYFTAIVDETGKLHTFRDVYGHERRITLALEGKWEQIVKGRDHLAPVEPNVAEVAQSRGAGPPTPGQRPQRAQHKTYGSGDFFSSLFGGF
jgi:L,D-transpeptidase YcbB